MKKRPALTFSSFAALLTACTTTHVIKSYDLGDPDYTIEQRGQTYQVYFSYEPGEEEVFVSRTGPQTIVEAATLYADRKWEPAQLLLNSTAYNRRVAIDVAREALRREGGRCGIRNSGEGAVLLIDVRDGTQFLGFLECEADEHVK